MWLEKNVKEVIKRVNNKDPVVEEYAEKYEIILSALKIAHQLIILPINNIKPTFHFYTCSFKTRMHSRRMRTVRCSCHLWVGGVCLGGMSTRGGLPRGVST